MGPSRTGSLSPDLVEAVRPTSLAGRHILPATAALAPLLPEAGLRRGTTLVVTGPGATSLASALAAGPSQAGSWCGIVGMGDLNPRALDAAGVALATTVLVPSAGSHWGAVIEALAAGVDIVLARPIGPVGIGTARRLSSQVRRQRSVLVLVSPPTPWAEAPDVLLALSGARWEGLEDGAGHLTRRTVDIAVSGRRCAPRTFRGQVV